MENFMMPPAGAPGELPPGLPMPAQVPMVNGQTQMPGTPPPVQEIPPMVAPNPQEQIAKQGLLQEEGATGPSPSGSGFFDKLRTDPKMSQAMLMMGMRMMQGGKPGQDTMGIIGDAMMAGAAAHNMLSYNEQEGQRKDADQAQRFKEGDARIAASNAQTEQTRQNMDFKAQLQPEELALAKERIVELKRKGKMDEARMLGDAVRNDPELVRKQIGAQIDASRASAASGYASAANSNASASDRKQELAWKRTIADPKASAEAKAAAEAGLASGSPGGRAGSAKIHDLESRAQILFKSGEVASLQEAYAKVYKDSTAKKGGNSEDLRYLADNSEDPEVRKWAAQELASGAGYGKPTGAADMSKWEKQGGFALKPGADRKLKSSWVQVQ